MCGCKRPLGADQALITYGSNSAACCRSSSPVYDLPPTQIRLLGAKIQAQVTGGGRVTASAYQPNALLRLDHAVDAAPVGSVDDSVAIHSLWLKILVD